MGTFWKTVNNVIEDADVLLLVLDARLISETRNLEIENKVRNLKKPLVYVITKCDLANKKDIEEKSRALMPSVYISATEKFGTTIMREKILIAAKRTGITGKIKVGVLGYPNVGKSSLINALKGRKSAGTSVESGHTKGIQKVKADNRIMLLDTPGVIPYQEEDPSKHAMIGTIDFRKCKDPDLVVMDIMQKYPGRVEKHYGVSLNEDYDEVIENIAKKRNILKKGAIPDVDRMSRMILMEWQKGVIR